MKAIAEAERTSLVLTSVMPQLL